MKKILLFALFLIIITSSCTFEFSTEEILGDRTFYAVQYNSSGDGFQIELGANLVKETEHLEIYLRVGQDMSASDIDYLANNFERYYSLLIDIYGTHTDVDENGKIILLLYDINRNYSYPANYIAGIFDPDNLVGKNSKPYSNEAEILYVESQASGDIENIFYTVIHEFQHLININMNLFQDEINTAESDLWLNEALSESTEIVLSGAMPAHRLNIYNSTKAVYHYSIQEGNYFYTWNDLADYATASLFMYWLYLNEGKNSIVRDIAQATSANRGTYLAVLEALKKRDFSNTQWEDVLFEWLAANEDTGTGYPNGKYKDVKTGREEELDLTSKIYEGARKSVSLFPGDAVVTRGFPSVPIISTLITKAFNPQGSPAFITLNKDTTIDGNYRSITLPQTQVVQRSAQLNMQTSLSDTGYRIKPLTQKPISFLGDPIKK